MFAFLGASQNIVFVSALLLMLLIGVVQAIGLGGDADLDIDSDADLLGWLGLGRLPLLILLVVLLTVFGTLGLIGQQLAFDLTGNFISSWIAVPAALVASLPLTGIAARLLAPILPQDHTTAIALDVLVGRPATIVTGRAAAGSPARARAEDRHGQAHYVMVEPNSDDQIFEEGETVLLVRHEDDRFRAVARGDHRLPSL